MNSPATHLIQPVAALCAGVALLWLPRRYRLAAQRRHAARLAELDAGAEEAFFEERRSLNAYPPGRGDWAWRVLGGILIALACLTFLLDR